MNNTQIYRRFNAPEITFQWKDFKGQIRLHQTASFEKVEEAFKGDAAKFFSEMLSSF